MDDELVIEALGAQGDGIATVAGAQVFIPFTLPGERVRADLDGGRGRLREVIEESPDRRTSSCLHFGTCGGCALQHMVEDAYLAWKRDQVFRAFAARGLSPEVSPVLPVAPASRRRAVLTARRGRGNSVSLGYHRRQDRELVDVQECPVLRPAIVAALPGLRGLLNLLLAGRSEARVTILETVTGLDVLVEGVPEPQSHHVLAGIAGLAANAGLIRLTVGSELLFQSGEPQIHLGKALLSPPPGAFLQAVASAESELAQRILAACAAARNVADLFCGAGTFALRLAGGCEVAAFELDSALLTALRAAGARSQGLKKLTIERRDLFREPLTARELGRFDAVVFDPPRAGARAQAQELAASKVPVVVAVSCNPATLARDARVLVDGGYGIRSVEPVDQFLYSPHVEVVAVLKRE